MLQISTYKHPYELGLKSTGIKILIKHISLKNFYSIKIEIVQVKPFSVSNVQWNLMDSLIEKKGKNSGWSARCHRLRNTEFVQYKRGIEDFKKCNDKLIKKRHNLCDIEDVKFGKHSPYILSLNYSQSTSIHPVLLKFKVDHLAYCAYFRILCASSKPSKNIKCEQRPIPSNIAFALYYLLQKLYKHQEVLRTPYIFQKRLQRTSSDHHVFKLYYNLVVNGRKFSKTEQKYDDIHLLSMTLRFCLENIPTSLFCDSFCRTMSNFVNDIISKSEQATKAKDKDYGLKLRQLPEYMDKDIFFVSMNKESLTKIKNMMLSIYGNTKKYIKEMGFSLINRYGFLTILFLLLHKISCSKYYKKTKVNPMDLAVTFSQDLQSKQYLFKCRTDALRSNNTNAPNTKTKDEQYEKRFIKMIKILIYFANDIFPDFKSVEWKIKSLILCQGNEQRKVEEYNDFYSRDIKVNITNFASIQ